MVWLNAANEYGNGLYLNIHRIEHRSQSLFALHGTLGDGFYEGEVLIEVGAAAEITFADAWLDREALDDFFGRMDRTEVEMALAETASEMLFRLNHFSSASSANERRRKHPRLPIIGRGGILNAA